MVTRTNCDVSYEKFSDTEGIFTKCNSFRYKNFFFVGDTQKHWRINVRNLTDIFHFLYVRFLNLILAHSPYRLLSLGRPSQVG